MTDTTHDDPLAQIARLREQIETLIREKAAPARDALLQDAEDAGQKAEALLREQIRALAEAARAHPIATVLGAAAVGFILGRASR